MAIEDFGFNQAELKVFALLGDEKGHAQWEICDILKLDKAYASKTLKGLKNSGLIFNEERSLIRPGKRGPQIEYPYYIQKDRLRSIVDTFLYQIQRYLRESMAAHREREILKVNGALTSSSEKGLTSEKILYFAKADILMNIFEIPLYRDCASKSYGIECISCEGVRGILYSEVGLIVDAEQAVRSPEDLYRGYLSKIEHAKKIEDERRKLEADPVAIDAIKKHALGRSPDPLRSLGYSGEAIAAQINQMRAIGEI